VQRPQWLVASRQWASDNYYEYVEVSSASTDADAQRGPDGGKSTQASRSGRDRMCTLKC